MPDTNKSRGFAFIEFEVEADVDRALDADNSASSARDFAPLL